MVQSRCFISVLHKLLRINAVISALKCSSPALVWISFDDSQFVPMNEMAKKVRKVKRVKHSGAGLDEIPKGFNQYRAKVKGDVGKNVQSVF